MDICIKCGAKKGSKPFIGLFCIDCYIPKIKLPKKMVVEVCKKCNRIKIKGEWKKTTFHKLGDYLGSKIKGSDVKNAWVDINNKCAYITLSKNDKIKIKRKVNVEVKYSICKECSRISGGYYEAIIQVRGNIEKIEKISEKIIRRLNKHSFVSKIEELKEGINIYAGSSKEALTIIKELGFKGYKISRKLAGLKEGKRIYRLTIAIRIQ